MKIEINFPDGALTLLDRMVETGVYGSTREAAIALLAADKLVDLGEPGEAVSGPKPKS